MNSLGFAEMAGMCLFIAGDCVFKFGCIVTSLGELGEHLNAQAPVLGIQIKLVWDGAETLVVFTSSAMMLFADRTAAAAAAKLLQSCPTLCNPIDGSPPGSAIPGIHPGNTGVGCHFLLQYMKLKSESEVARCLTLSNPMDCSLSGSSTHGIFQASVLEWVAIAFSGRQD